MKKITVIFGGTVGLYQGYFKIFEAIEKEFNCIIRRISPFKFSGKIGNIKIDFEFCINPIKDKNYFASKKYLETSRWKELVPPSANDVVKKIKSDYVLFFGICGAFKGKKNQIYIPEEFKEIFFKETSIKYKHIMKITPKNKITIKNILANKVKGIKSKVITSNMTLTHKNIEKESKDHLIALANILIKHGDLVDKEMYQIAKYFNNKIPLGIMVMSSDILTVKKHMLEDKTFNLNIETFNKSCIEALKTIIEKDV